MISEIDIVIRLAVAVLLGMIVGFERERHNQPAGFRTHAMLAVGSCLAMIVSINMAIEFYPNAPNGDPARLAAQVISGIGFLGAGAILRYGSSVKGLTTATSLWSVAIVGLAVGAGHYFAAAATVIAMLIVLSILNVLEKKYIRTYRVLEIVVTVQNNQTLVEDLQAIFKSMKKSVISLGVEEKPLSQELTVSTVVKTLEHEPLVELRKALEALPGVLYLKIDLISH